ncbi:MAG: AI-2E family transporter [Thermoleophilaceae bacterium]
MDMNYRALERVAYRTVLLVAVLVLAALAFRQLATLAVAVLATVLVAILLDAAARPLERRGLSRRIGALVALLCGVAIFASVLVLIVPPFVHQTDKFVNNVPHVANDLQGRIHEITGASKSEIGHRAQKFARGYTDHPEKLIGPLTSIGFSVAGIAVGVVLLLIIAYYMAARPEPLLNGLLRMFPPERRDHAHFVMGRLRDAWVGWMQGVIVNMIVTGVLVYIGLALIGLDYALVFAVISGLFVLVPYYGAFVAGIPPVLFALADSPGKALLALVVYVGAHEVEGNLTVPLVMAKTVQLHPAVIAIGVLVVGRLMGFAGLFVAVPVLSFMTITIEEFWIKPMEDAERRRAREELELPSTAAEDEAPAAPPPEPFALEEVVD